MYDTLIKKRNKILIIFIAWMFGSFLFAIPGGILLDKNETDPVGIAFIVLLFVSFIASVIWGVVASSKITKVINQENLKLDKAQINKIEGKREFISELEETIVFNTESFSINEANYNYTDYMFAAAFRYDKGKLTPVLAIVGEETYRTIILDGDILEVIREYNIPLQNKDDLDFYLKNMEQANKQANRLASFRPAPLIPMIFKKNSDDKKVVAKATATNIITLVLMLVGVIAINVGIIWFTSSKLGNDISNKMRMDIIIKIAMTIILLILAFVKAKKVKWYGKLSIILYLVTYWLSVIFLGKRIGLLFSSIFLIVFVVIGILSLDFKRLNEKNKTNPYNPFSRFFGIAIFLGFILLFTITDHQLVYENRPFLYALFVMLGILVITSICLVIYLKSEKGRSLPKKQKIINTVTALVCAIMFGFLVSWVYIVNLNYALDTSKPVVNDYIVVGLEKGEDNESDCAIIYIEGKKVEIPVSTDKYYELKIGDVISVSLYEGAFNLAYYIYEEE